MDRMCIFRLTLLLAVVGAGCGGGTTAPASNADKLVGKWAFASSDGVTGEALNIYADGTYELFVLQATSATSGNVQEETGTYTATESAATTTPAKWSCPGPDPVATLAYKFSGANLVLTEPSGAIIMQPNTAPAPDSYVITLGCFVGGVFMPAPLAPVSN